jgi:hypothetical protein
MSWLQDKTSRILRAKWLLGFALVFAALCAGLVALEMTNFNYGGIWLRDFQVFHHAGIHLRSGETLFQPARDGYYSYKYSPTAAFLFVPFSFFPLPVAEVFYWVFISLLVIAGFYLSLAVIKPDFRNADPRRLAIIVVVAGLVLGVHIWSELTLGQVNHMLLVMYVTVAYLFSRNRPALLAFIWAMSIFIKPFGLILLPYFVMKKRFREVAWFAGFSGLLFLLPSVVYGTRVLTEQRHWYSEILFELRNKEDVFQAGNHTLASVFARYASLDAFGLTPGHFAIYRYTVILAAGLLFLLVILRGAKVRRPEALDFAFLLTLTPLLSYTNDSLFGFAELAVFLVLLNFGQLRMWERAAACCGFVMIGGNFFNQLPQDWANSFFSYFESISLLALGTVTLLATIVALRWRQAC